MLRGPATQSFYAAEHDEAKRWYTELFGFQPYFDMPGYAEWRVGDYESEFGIIDAAYAPPGATDGPAGAIMFWAVDDLDATLERLFALGAKEYQPITERGSGFVTAAVVDPFGNILGIMRNPHYLEIVARTTAGATA